MSTPNGLSSSPKGGPTPPLARRPMSLLPRPSAPVPAPSLFGPSSTSNQTQSNSTPTTTSSNIPPENRPSLQFELPATPPSSSPQTEILSLFANADPNVANDILRRVGAMLRNGARLPNAPIKPDPGDVPVPAPAGASFSGNTEPRSTEGKEDPYPEPWPQRMHSSSSSKKRKRDEDSSDSDCLIVEVKQEPSNLGPEPPKRSKHTEELSEQRSDVQLLRTPVRREAKDRRVHEEERRKEQRAVRDEPQQPERRNELDLDDSDSDQDRIHDILGPVDDDDWQEGRTLDDGSDGDNDAEDGDDNEIKTSSKRERLYEGSTEFDPSSPTAVTAKKSLEIINQECFPAYARRCGVPDCLIVTSIYYVRHFAGRSGWVYFQFSYTLNGKQIVGNRALGKALQQLYPDAKHDNHFSLIELWGLSAGKVGWHPLRVLLSAEVRRGEQAYDPGTFKPLAPYVLSPDHQRYLKAADPTGKVEPPTVADDPCRARLEKLVTILRKSLPTVIRGFSQGQSYGVWYAVDVQNDSRLRLQVEIDGVHYSNLRQITRILQQEISSKNPDRLYLCGSRMEGEAPTWFQMGSLLPGRIRRGEVELTHPPKLIIPSELPDSVMSRVTYYYSNKDKLPPPSEGPVRIRRIKPKESQNFSAKSLVSNRHGALSSSSINEEAEEAGHLDRDQLMDLDLNNDDVEIHIDSQVGVILEHEEMQDSAHQPRQHQYQLQQQPPQQPQQVQRPQQLQQTSFKFALQPPRSSSSAAPPVSAALALTLSNSQSQTDDARALGPTWDHLIITIFDGAYVEDIISHNCCANHTQSSQRFVFYSKDLLRQRGAPAGLLLSWRQFIEHVFECRTSVTYYLLYHSELASRSKNAAKATNLLSAFTALSTAMQVLPQGSLETQIIESVRLLCSKDQLDAAAEVMRLWEAELEWLAGYPFACPQCESRFNKDSECRICGLKCARAVTKDKRSLRRAVMDAIGVEAVANLFTLI